MAPGDLNLSGCVCVVIVSSVAPPAGPDGLDDLQGANGYSTWVAHARSQSVNVLFAAELARRLDGTGVTATRSHPEDLNR